MNRRRLMKAYRCSCQSKLETLSKYRFSLCLENMPMEGYVTEKIFDCFYAGTVPIYRGGSRIEKYVPTDTFIDGSRYGSWREMWNDIKNMPPKDWEEYRLNARAFLVSQGRDDYFGSLTRIIGNAASQA